MNVTNSFHVKRLSSPVAFLMSVLICFAALKLGEFATEPSLPWYGTLRKPFFTPPNWAFPAAWTTIFAMMAIALWRVVRAYGVGHNRALIPFGVQLALNVSWSFAFFAAQSPKAGAAVIVLLIPAIVWTVVAFGRKDRLAGLLLAPYLVWVLYAALLNAAIWRLNA